jgi:predicted component of type VI protein secretion system
MKLAKWNDGYVLDTDPRREDPLYYYMQEGGWGSALGIEVAPLYEEHKAAAVCIRVWPDHLPREAVMSTSERHQMYPRVISVLLGRFPHWSRVTMQSSHLAEIVERTPLSATFMAAGFAQIPNTAPDETTWTRT